MSLFAIKPMKTAVDPLWSNIYTMERATISTHPITVRNLFDLNLEIYDTVLIPLVLGLCEHSKGMIKSIMLV